MARTTKPETLKSRRQRRCDWCAESIQVGDYYVRYRSFDCGDAGTSRLHPECLWAAEDLARRDPTQAEFHPGDHPRGCNCGFDHACGCWLQRKQA